MLFGELDSEPDGTVFVEQHTSIAIPWLQAKLMHYFLTLQLGSYEMSHGRIPIPEAVMPPDATPPEGLLEDDPRAIKLYEFVKKKREEFLSQNQ